ncbi:MAG: hypothetical protein U1E47_08280 [Rivihabitans pingtungensis]
MLETNIDRWEAQGWGVRVCSVVKPSLQRHCSPGVLANCPAAQQAKLAARHARPAGNLGRPGAGCALAGRGAGDTRH